MFYFVKPWQMCTLNVFYKIYLPLSYFLEFHKNSPGKILFRQNIQKSWSSENQIEYDF